MNVKKTTVYFLLLLSIALFLYLFPFKENPFTKKVETIAYYILSPFLKVEREIEEEIEKTITFFKEFKGSLRYFTRVKKSIEKVKLLEKEVEKYRNLLANLERDLDFEFPKGVNYILSKIIFYDPSGKDLFFIIKDGRNKGIKKGDLVVSKGYVIGVVEEVYISTSKVSTLYSKKTSFLATIKGKRKSYIYRGGYPFGKLLYVNVEDKVKVGDEVVYKDLTLKIPPFTVGNVISVSLSPNPFFKEVKVKPAISPREVEFVVIFKE